MSDGNIVKRRPTEAATPIAAAVAGLITYALGVESQEVYLALIVIVGFVPTGITWLVSTIRGPADQ